MSLIEIPAPEFDLAMTLDSGQVFHWRGAGEGFVGSIGEEPIYIEQAGFGKPLRFAGGTSELIRHYFALDHQLNSICASFPKDAAMDEAQRFCRGLRIMRQPKWICLASFITSSMKQVAHIRQMSAALRGRFGERKEVCGNEVHTFPGAAALARVSEAQLRECALGYRAKNLLATARMVTSGDADLGACENLPDHELRRRLCALPGVGAKVANCVMLFAYERLQAFPIDVWIARVLKERYFPRKRKMTDRAMSEFAQGYFGEHGGYAQQYLFHHARKTTPRKPLSKASRGRLEKASRASTRSHLSGRPA